MLKENSKSVLFVVLGLSVGEVVIFEWQSSLDLLYVLVMMLSFCAKDKVWPGSHKQINIAELNLYISQRRTGDP